MGQIEDIETRLAAIRARFLDGAALTPKDLANRKDVAFLLNRLTATEHEAARLLRILQKKIRGEAQDEARRLQLVREKATEFIHAAEMTADLRPRSGERNS